MIALLLTLVLALQGIPVQAQQSGTVSGVLKDAEGKPVAGIRMAAIARPQSVDEAITGAAMSSLSETDEQGRYTLESIPPGRYYIAAGRLDAPTYYPGTTDMATAKEVAITPGLTVSGIDFTLGNSSFGRSINSLSFTPSAVAVPLRVTVEGGGKVPLSGGGKFTSVKLDMTGSTITTPITNGSVSVPGPQATSYSVTVENLPDTYVVKSITYGSTDLLTNTLRLTPANFASAGAPLGLAVQTFVQLANGTLQISMPQGVPATAGPPVVPAPGPTAAPAPVPQLGVQSQAPTTLQADLAAALLQLRGQITAAAGTLAAAPSAGTPPSLLSITLTPVPPTPSSGARVSGRMSVAGRRTVYVSGIPGAAYSDGTFEVYGVPPGRHLIVTRDNPTGAKPLGASVVVESGNLDGIVLAETAMLPIRAWEPSPPRPGEGRPAGNIPLARLTGTLVEELSRKPISEGTVHIKSNSYHTASFTVDAEGRFELPPLLPGAYELELQIFGHSNSKQWIEIDDKDIKVEISSRRLY